MKNPGDELPTYWCRACASNPKLPGAGWISMGSRLKQHTESKQKHMKSVELYEKQNASGAQRISNELIADALTRTAHAGQPATLSVSANVMNSEDAGSASLDR